MSYDIREFVTDLCTSGITLHLPQNIQHRRRFALDRPIVRHQGYGQSINTSKQIE
jgi:hypothetical protein